jgi:hypothetical protein
VTLDAGDLLYVGTHGGTNDALAAWALYQVDSLALSANMKLGDSPYGGLSVYSTYSCMTHAPDSHLWERWSPIFEAGLRYSTGSHGFTYADDDAGKDFATHLQAGSTLKHAWFDALTKAYSGNDAIVLSSGKTLSDCEKRRDFMVWRLSPAIKFLNQILSWFGYSLPLKEFADYPRINGSNVNWICWHGVMGDKTSSLPSCDPTTGTGCTEGETCFNIAGLGGRCAK